MSGPGSAARSGYLLEDHYDQVEGWLEPLSYVVVAGILVTYAWHIWSTRMRRRS
jgi:hypothetical protein